MIWNRRDLGQERHRAIQEIIEPFRREAPAYHTDEWRFAFQQTGLFALRDETRIPFAQELGAEQFVDRVMSTSFISALEGEEREEVLGRLRALAAEDSEPLRYICEIFVYARR